ncbi:hypothetical protein QJQ45_009438 [Haematococcus lacustris]|nr:hypothetical protein QJQ45_009438 [Haematococcus lacustris]
MVRTCSKRGCTREAREGRLQCLQCTASAARTAAKDRNEKTESQCSARSCKNECGAVLAVRRYTALMFPAGPNGPRATCVELVTNPDDPDGPLKLCGGFGTVNRIMSDIKSYSHKDQRCNVLCHQHNANHEGRRNGELATAAMAATAAAKAPPEPGSSKGCPIELD